MKEKENNVFKTYKEQIKEALNDLKTKGKRHKQIPNILTTLRLTAPFFIIPAAIMGNIPLVIGLTTGFGLTDLADGFIARKWNLTSELGKDLDAFCDKMFAGTLLLATSIANPLLLINVGLEIAIASINIHQKFTGCETGSTMIGKLKTWSLFGLVGAGLLNPLFPVPTLLASLMVVTTGMQLLTVKSYLKKYPKKQNIKKEEIRNEEQSTTIEVEEKGQNELSKEKIKEPIQSTPNSQIKDESTNNTEELRRMRDSLLYEKENKKEEIPQSKVLQKR